MLVKGTDARHILCLQLHGHFYHTSVSRQNDTGIENRIGSIRHQLEVTWHGRGDIFRWRYSRDNRRGWVARINLLNLDTDARIWNKQSPGHQCHITLISVPDGGY